MTWRRALVGLLVLVALGFGWRVLQSRCWSAWFQHGVQLNECPVGRMQPEILMEVRGLRRGSPGLVRIETRAVYSRGWSTGVERTPIRRGSATLSLVTDSSTIAVTPNDGWSRDAEGVLVGRITLPADLPDGRHRLVARANTSLGTVESSLKLPVFAPARILVMTDRPLYEAGNLVRFRAVALRAKDLAPLDDRPGRWQLEAPDGTRVLEERSEAGPYGVAFGDFPLDEAAATGKWTLRWRSGEDEGSTTFRVEPFELPRFSIEASPARPHYGPQAVPVVQGTVRYASGAPVAEAVVAIDWRVDGRWPPPTVWRRGGLVTRVVADRQGRFELRLPRVPNDLLGTVTLRGALAATDATGDRVTGGVSVLLSKDDISVDTVTELADGLVEGFNNRLYLRVSTAAGSVLRQTRVRITRAWDPGDEGQIVTTDVDGVAALQIDPGPAVTVVEPGYPVRPAVMPAAVERVGLIDHLRRSGPTLADQSVLDKVPFARCARHVADSPRVRTVVWVSAAGKVDEVLSVDGALPACVAGQLRGTSFPRGRARLYEMRHRFNWNGPRVSLVFDGPDAPPDELRSRLNGRAIEARKCLPASATSAAVPQMVAWRVDGRGRIRAWPVPDRLSGRRQPASVTGCLVRTVAAAASKPLSNLAPDEAMAAVMGFVRMRVSAAPSRRTTRAADTTYLGYELKVEALADDERIGETKVRLRPGQIPPLRLRASPVVAEPGATVEVKALRGPSYTGDLPDKLVLINEGHRIESKLDGDTRVARFELPKDRSGWYEVRYDGATAVVFVPDQRKLTVEVASDKKVYSPGAQARLQVRTTADGAGQPAMVGLFGVDQSLAQLAPLPGPDVWSQLLSTPTLAGPAFGAIDAVALASGRVRGPAALAATVLKVTRVPSPEAIDRSVTASHAQLFDPIIPLTDTFYELLARLMDRVRKWDAEAPPKERMTPPKMAQLWDEMVAAAPAKLREDPFGRRMQLHILPDDLLALVDPRVVVANGTRLPEDVENWTRWVRRNRR